MSTIIDDSSGAGYAEVGTWNNLGNGYLGNSRYAGPNGSGTRTATWTFTGLTAGTVYRLSATWDQQGNLSTVSPFRVYDSDGTTPLGDAVLIDQTAAPNDLTADTRNWEDLGYYAPSGTSLKVQLTDNATNYVLADAIRLNAENPARKTTTQDGNWSATATWGGLTPPTTGEMATTRAADTITQDIDVTIGTDPANVTNFDLEILGPYTVAAGKTLRVRGNTRQGNCTVTVGAGGAIKADFTAAANSKYLWQLGTATGQSSKIVLNGTSGAHCAVDVVGTGKVYFTSFSGGLCGCHLDATYTDFRNVNNASNSRAFEYDPTVVGPLKLSHCTADGCGSFYGVATATEACQLSFTDSTFTNPQDASNGHLRLPVNTTTLTTGTREIRRCYIDSDAAGPAATLGESQFTLTDNVFVGVNCLSLPFSSGTWTLWQHNLAVLRAAGASQIQPLTISGNMTAWTYVLADNQNGNPHILNMTQTLTADGVIFEYTGPNIGDGGDGFLGGGAAGGNLIYTAALSRVIILPSQADGYMSCCLANVGNEWAVSITHCTLHLGNQGGFAIGDFDNVAGSCPVFKSNLGYIRNGDPTGTLGPLFFFSAHNAGNPTLDVQDVVTPSGVDKNAGWNLLSGYSRDTQFPGVSGKGYQTNTSAAVGTTDIDLGSGGTGPDFVDGSRNFGAWAASRGSSAGTYAGKVADGLAYLAADPTLIASSLVPYVRDGFAPRDSRLQTAGHDGQDIGAVPGVFTVGTQPKLGGEGPVHKTIRPAAFAPGSPK